MTPSISNGTAPISMLTASAIREYLMGLKASCPEAAARMAESQRQFEEIRAKKLADRDFRKYLLTFESHQRLEPFLAIIPQLSDEEYWRTLAEIWIGAEAILPDWRIWLRLLQSARPGREHLMTAVEHAGLASMPGVIKIWRGCGERAAVRGLSWTLDRKLAVTFAERACGVRHYLHTGLRGSEPLIVEATCERAHVLAYFTGRSEAEVVVSPRHVYVRRVSPYSPKELPI